MNTDGDAEHVIDAVWLVLLSVIVAVPAFPLVERVNVASLSLRTLIDPIPAFVRPETENRVLAVDCVQTVPVPKAYIVDDEFSYTVAGNV